MGGERERDNYERFDVTGALHIIQTLQSNLAVTEME